MVTALSWTSTALVLDISGRTAPPGQADAIVVAGCGVEAGGLPSDCLATRTDRAVSLFEQGVAPVLLFTGGVGEHPPSEAEVAATRAMAQGVPASAILLEPSSTSTEENARYAAALSPSRQVVVVSDAWHTHRVRWVFGRHFEQVDTVGVDGPLPDRIYGAHREVLAIGWYLVSKGYWRDLLS